MDSGPPSQIYFAENLGSYVLTGAEQAEFNYQREGATDQFTRYKGKDGVKLSNFVRRAAFALRFGSLDPLISGQINSNTKLLHGARHPLPASRSSRRSCSSTPTPTRSCSATARCGSWTATPRPTSTRTRRRCGERGLAVGVVQLRAQLGEGHRRRVRGHGHLLRVRREGPDHPGLRGRRSPTSSPTARGCPKELREHLRYPEDLFKSQATMFGRYHVTEPKRFYDGSANWLVSPDPGSGRGVERPAVGGDRGGRQRDRVGEQPAAGGDLDRRPHRSVLPQHPAPGRRPTSTSSSPCRSCRCRRATARRASCRSSPPTPIPGSTASCSRSRCRRVRPSRARSR